MDRFTEGLGRVRAQPQADAATLCGDREWSLQQPSPAQECVPVGTAVLWDGPDQHVFLCHIFTLGTCFKTDQQCVLDSTPSLKMFVCLFTSRAL